MDEAGGYANTQLIRLVDAFFILLPAPDPLLRTLTLGVLIVTGGTLAALPFRRYQAIPDASSAPAQVTGPMQSVLQSNAAVDIAADRSQQQSAFDSASYGYGRSTGAYDSIAHRRAVTQITRQRADIPLSYQDLEIPIDQPDPIKQRFNAAAPIRAEQLARERAAGLLMPAMETLAASQVDQIEIAANQFVDASIDNAKVTGSLASARDADVEQLPQGKGSQQDADRERHWIRQPD